MSYLDIPGSENLNQILIGKMQYSEDPKSKSKPSEKSHGTRYKDTSKRSKCNNKTTILLWIFMKQSLKNWKIKTTYRLEEPPWKSTGLTMQQKWCTNMLSNTRRKKSSYQQNLNNTQPSSQMKKPRNSLHRDHATTRLSLQQKLQTNSIAKHTP